MDKENFRKLKEFDSLMKMRDLQEMQKIDQKKRITQLQETKQEYLAKKNDLNLRLHDINQQLFEIDQKLKINAQQSERLKQTGKNDLTLEAYHIDAAEQEEKGFALLALADIHRTKLEEVLGFLKGLDKTIEEISQEVNLEVTNLDTSMSNLKLRLGLIMEDLPLDYRKLLEKTLKKKLAFGPFTKLLNCSCFFCRFKMSKVDESEIDTQLKLKTCSQCDRIFLPYGI